MTRGRLNLYAALLICLLLIWNFNDYWRAVGAIERAAPTDINAIVVLTGGPKRVRAGLELLAAGASDRLIISGVGENVTTDAILNANSDVKLDLPVNIEIDRARDTAENAAEIAAWAAANDIKTILLVTADYHMPRSLLLFGKAAPNLVIRPYPVDAGADVPTHVAEWLKLRATTLGFGG